MARVKWCEASKSGGLQCAQKVAQVESAWMNSDVELILGRRAKWKKWYDGSFTHNLCGNAQVLREALKSLWG